VNEELSRSIVCGQQPALSYSAAEQEVLPRQPALCPLATDSTLALVAHQGRSTPYAKNPRQRRVCSEHDDCEDPLVHDPPRIRTLNLLSFGTLCGPSHVVGVVVVTT
jgi:hypothetical protein